MIPHNHELTDSELPAQRIPRGTSMKSAAIRSVWKSGLSANVLVETKNVRVLEVASRGGDGLEGRAIRRG